MRIVRIRRENKLVTSLLTYLEIKGGGKFTFETTERLSSNLELIGLAQARILVRAFKVVMIPAFATEMVCCSYNIHRSVIHFKEASRLIVYPP
jgi:hypothetical protein